MDTAQPPVQTPLPPIPPMPVVTPVQSDTSGSNKKLLIIITVLIILTVATGGLIYLRNSNIFKASAPVQSVINTFDDLRGELESTDVGASENDLSAFDKDLNSL